MSTYLITGANRGIGLELATQLARRGEQVVATYRDAATATALLALPGVRTLRLEVTDQRSVDQLADSLAGVPIDTLINNAGVSSATPTLASCTFESLSAVLTTNSIAPIMVTKALLPNLTLGKGKTIINISSVLGSLGMKHQGSSYGYRASKSALNMLTQKLATELAGFTVIAIHPGWVQTDMGGPNATLTVEQSAQTLLATFSRLTPATSGGYFNTDGSPLPW